MKRNGLLRCVAGVMCAIAMMGLLAPTAAAVSLPETLVQAETQSGTLADITPESVDKLLVMDVQTGMVLAHSNSVEQFVPTGGAVTLMTAYLALRSGMEQVTVPDGMDSYDLAVGLEEGGVYRTQEMVSAMLMTGAQDCAAALAGQLAGSQEAFVQQMNETAALLGMKNTMYVNCTGAYDEEQTTTAEDLARLAYAVNALGMTDVFAQETLQHEALGGTQALTNRVTLMQPEHESYDARVAAGFGSGSSQAGANTVLLADAGDVRVAVVAVTQRSERRLYEAVRGVLDALQGGFTVQDVSNEAEEMLYAQLSVPENVQVSLSGVHAAVTTESGYAVDREKLHCDVQLTDVQPEVGAVYAMAQVRYGDMLLDEVTVTVTAVEQQATAAPTPTITPTPAPKPTPARVQTVLPEGYEPYKRSIYDRFGWIFWSAAAIIGALVLWYVPKFWENRRR